MWTFSSSRSVRVALAPLLSLWIAGAGCMLGCQGMAAAAAGEHHADAAQPSGHRSTIVASGHACSAESSSTVSAGNSGGSHACCHKSNTEVKVNSRRSSEAAGTSIESGASSSGMMKDCPLAGTKAAVAAKNRGSETNVSPAVVHYYLPAQNLLEQPAPLSTPSRLSNRGHTYLRCCVFLI